MTHNDQFIERLEYYLDDYVGVTPLPDAVRNAVRAELPRTKQVTPVAGLTRFLNMTLQLPAPARYGLAAAVLFVVAVIGASVLNRPNTGGPSGSPESSPTSVPSGTAVPSATGPRSLLDFYGSGNLDPGAYYLDHEAFPARIDFEVPAGWWYWYEAARATTSTAHAILVDSEDTGAANGSAWGIGFTVVDSVRNDPCDAAAGYMESSASESANALAEAFGSWPDFPVVSVEDVNIGDYPGKRVEITRAEGIDCDGSFFRTPTGYGFGPQFSSSEPVVNQFALLDVDGSVLVIWTTDFPGTTTFEEDGGAAPDSQAHAADQVQLRQILQSVVITPR